METQNISYVLEGRRSCANVTLLSSLSWIFLVAGENSEPFHLEYNEELHVWEAIEAEMQDEIVCNAIGQELMKIYGDHFEASQEPTSPYFISKNQSGDMICFWDLDLRIRVSSLSANMVFDDEKEPIFFGQHQNHALVFQTVDYNGEDLNLIADAIDWYTDQQNYNEMKVTHAHLVSEDNEPAASFN